MAPFTGLDDQGGLFLLPYGFIFQLSQLPEGSTSFVIIFRVNTYFWMEKSA